MATGIATKVVRAGVFNRVGDAQAAVTSLENAGFNHREISVVCSEPQKARVFGDLAEEHPIRRKGSTFLARAAAFAVGVGLVALVVSTFASTTTVIVIVAALGALVLAVGPLQALMMTRGYEKESVDFYDQALQRDDILVAVEVHDDPPAPRLAEAERILKQSGARTVELPEG
jgi:hypothetical protein